MSFGFDSGFSPDERRKIVKSRIRRAREFYSHLKWEFNKDRVHRWLISNPDLDDKIKKIYGDKYTESVYAKEIGMMSNQNPVDRFFETVEAYGKPTLLIPTPGGVAIWKLKGPCFKEITIRDEVFYHPDPAPHVDFYETVVEDSNTSTKKMSEKRSEVVQLSDSAYTDPLAQTSVARCHFEHANNVTHYLIALMHRNEINLSEAQELYGRLIMKGLKKTMGHPMEKKYPYKEGFGKKIKSQLQAMCYGHVMQKITSQAVKKTKK